MEIETMVISTETITPSSPSPKSLQKHNLSKQVDQLMPPLFMSFVFFYPSIPIIPNSQKSKQLKKSLSEILPRYYPLAGHLIGNLYVDCNDAGVPFYEAQAECDVSQAITNKNPNLVQQKFLPYKTDDPRDFCMAVQASHFRCGGLAIGILLSHKIADGLSFISFANTWSAVVRNGDCGGVPPPKFDAAAYFPPVNILGFQPPSLMEEEGDATCRILTFPALREKYTDRGRRPSRVEALLAFIWTRFTSATGMTSDPRRICNVMRNPVNLRVRSGLEI